MIAAPDLPAGLTLHRLADRPDLITGAHDIAPIVWPHFMMQGSAGEDFYVELESTFRDCALLVTDADGDVVCRALWVPFVWDGTLPLPDRGWDWVIEAGIADRKAGRTCTAASALEIGIVPALRGHGLSGILLAHMRRVAAEGGAGDLFAPVRPNGKHRFPAEPMKQYLHRVRDDGLPDDGWLRVHVRAGAEILGPCEHSMHIEGTVAEWHEWTGRDLSTPGPHEVPHALAPVVSDGQRAVYIEPNVWVRHRLR